MARLGGGDRYLSLPKDFSNASFPPETISMVKIALDAAVASLPDPVSSAHVSSIAESILRTTREGKRNPATLQRTALVELQIAPRHRWRPKPTR